MLRILLCACFLFALTSIHGQHPLVFTDANWVMKSPFPGGARDDGSAFAIGPHGFFGCGIDQSYRLRNDWWRLDTATFTWSAVDSLPGLPRQYATAVSAGDRAYLVGGIRSDGVYGREVFRYRPGEGWTRLSDAPFAGRAAAAAARVGGMIYYGTGRNDTVKFNDFWAFDVVRETWVQLDTLPFEGRDEVVAFAASGRVYFLLGRSGEGSFRDCWRYDPVLQAWEARDDFPGRASSYAAVVEEPGGAIVGGGNDELGALTGEAFYFHAATEEWTAIQPLPAGPVRGMEGFRIGTKAVFCGGLTTSFTRLDAVQVLNIPALETRSFLRVWPVPARRRLNIYAEVTAPGGATLALTNLTGNTVLEKQLRTGTHLEHLDLANVGSGLYFLRFQSGRHASVKTIAVAR